MIYMYNIRLTARFSLDFLRGLAVVCWTTDHYYLIRISGWAYLRVVSSFIYLDFYIIKCLISNTNRPCYWLLKKLSVNVMLCNMYITDTLFYQLSVSLHADCSDIVCWYPFDLIKNEHGYICILTHGRTQRYTPRQIYRWMDIYI